MSSLTMKDTKIGNIQTYQLQMINSGEGVNYQMQIVTSF